VAWGQVPIPLKARSRPLLLNARNGSKAVQAASQGSVVLSLGFSGFDPSLRGSGPLAAVRLAELSGRANAVLYGEAFVLGLLLAARQLSHYRE